MKTLAITLSALTAIGLVLVILASAGELGAPPAHSKAKAAPFENRPAVRQAAIDMTEPLTPHVNVARRMRCPTETKCWVRISWKRHGVAKHAWWMLSPDATGDWQVEETWGSHGHPDWTS